MKYEDVFNRFQKWSINFDESDAMDFWSDVEWLYASAPAAPAVGELAGTPRTDELEGRLFDLWNGLSCSQLIDILTESFQHARKLETELAALSALSQSRAEIIEECARVCENETCDQTEYSCETVNRCAEAIRALPPPPGVSMTE